METLICDYLDDGRVRSDSYGHRVTDVHMVKDCSEQGHKGRPLTT
jgi:hypothetical protein